MRWVFLAAVVALAPTIGWAQLLPPSPPIQSEPLPPPNMQAPSGLSGAGQAQPMQPPFGGAPGPTPPAAQAPGAPDQGVPSAPLPGVVQPPQLPGTTQPLPAPLSPGGPPPGQLPQQSGPLNVPGQAQGAPEQPAGAAPPAPPPPNAWVAQGGAIVQVLDKVNAANTTLHVKVGQSVEYRSLRIQVLACAVRPPNMPSDAAVSLVIKDTTPDQPGFQGWMLQNEPFLSMLQSPSYDVRVEGCTP